MWINVKILAVSSLLGGWFMKTNLLWISDYSSDLHFYFHLGLNVDLEPRMFYWGVIAILILAILHFCSFHQSWVLTGWVFTSNQMDLPLNCNINVISLTRTTLGVFRNNLTLSNLGQFSLSLGFAQKKPLPASWRFYMSYG